MTAITQWRATGDFLASSSLVPGIPEETRIFLTTYGEITGSPDERLEQTRELLVAERLPQRARASRVTMVNRILKRLFSWNPPAWVLDDFIRFANQGTLDNLKAVLLIHVCRQDHLLYTLVQTVIRPAWAQGNRQIAVGDVHRFLDKATPDHPEIEEWTRSTREKLCSTVLSTLRDYGLLQGKAHKQIVEPVIPAEAIRHQQQLLLEEGIAPIELYDHPDWQLWLWTPARVREELSVLQV